MTRHKNRGCPSHECETSFGPLQFVRQLIEWCPKAQADLGTDLCIGWVGGLRACAHVKRLRPCLGGFLRFCLQELGQFSC
jgi:hypothetical protein